tara:strand:- start:139 stop:5235 length:5097 start_codon:yes stop_codon:yes gene_type:complete
MKQLHHPKDSKTYVKGANRDIEKEFLSGDEGSYLDACNMRPTDMDGDNGALPKIKGEKIHYAAVDNNCQDGTSSPLSSSYKCIGTVEVNDNIIEFWADENQALDSFVRINGTIVLKSPDFPIRHDYPLQIAKNESCAGGEVYVTDNFNTPMFFNVEDLMINAGIFNSSDCSDKYFSQYNPNQYKLSLQGSLNVPKFIDLESTGSTSISYRKRNGAGGLPVGTYAYAMRYVSDSGERTNVGMFTPTIPVVSQYSSQSTIYPYSKTMGDLPNETNLTQFAIRLRVRVSNTNNYDYIEIIRIRWTSGTALGTPPAGEVILKIDIEEGEVGSFDVEDASLSKVEDLTQEEEADVLNAVAKAKSIRYYENKLYLGNVQYASKDIDTDLTFDTVGGVAKIHPTIEALGKSGHSLPYNYAYHKSYMSTEKYGFGIVAMDENGSRSFVKKIDGAGNVEVPSRRDPVSQETIDTSIKGIPKAALTLGGANYCHEVFDMDDAVGKTERCSFVNMIDEGRKCYRNVGDGEQNFGSCSNADSLKKISTSCAGKKIKCKDLGFRGLRPYYPADSYTNHNYNPTQEIYRSRTGKVVSPSRKMFAPNYYAKGFSIEGINLPSWVKSFSIMRTQPAKKVEAQGLAFYALKSADGLFGANTMKYKNRVWFYSPDMNQDSGLYPQIFDQVLSGVGTGEYSLKMESPLGFSSEYYNFNEKACGAVPTFGIDMISYARLMRDKVSAEFNPMESSSMGIPGPDGQRYVSWGEWRRESSPIPPAFGTGTNSNLFNITNIKVIKGAGTTAGDRGGHYWEVTLDKDVYASGGLGSGYSLDFQDEAVRNWHEPVYVCSIVRNANSVEDPQIQDYIPTGQIQHVRSLVAASLDDTDPITANLVDERWEDCIPDLQDSSGNQIAETLMPTQSAEYYNLDRFVTVIDSQGNEKKWINCTFKTASQINTILQDIQNNGYYQSTDGSSTRVYGIYKHTDYNNRRFALKFDTGGWPSGVNTSLYPDDNFIPKKGHKVYVDWDKRIPIRFFGGDTYVGESVHPIYDLKYKSTGCPIDAANKHRINIGMPYRKVTVNKRIFMVKSGLDVLSDNIQNVETLKHDKILGQEPSRMRQWLLMYTAETRHGIPYFYGESTPRETLNTFFPITHYRQRPNKWNDNNPTVTTHDAYTTEYGDEVKYWNYGGFRFTQMTNIDYAQYNNFTLYTSKPKVGFTDQSKFCTRIIWSAEKPVNVQDSPSVRSFPALNVFDLSDNTGEIKYLFDSDSGKGNNLIAFTDSGIAICLTDKRIISEVSGSQLAAIESATRGVQKQIWLTKRTGMSDEMWRTAAESGSSIYFANYNSAYRLTGNQLEDIGRKKYHSRLWKDFLQKVGTGYSTDLTGVYNTLHNEYWISFNDKENNTEVDTSSVTYLQWNPISSDAIGSVLNIAYNGNVANSGNQYFGVSAASPTLFLTGTPTDDSVIVIGGFNGQLLTTAVKVVVDPTGNSIRFKNPFTNVITVVNPGEAYYITVFVDENQVVTSINMTATYNEFSGVKKQKCVTPMFGALNDHWLGTNSHDFDRYLSFDNELYGMRNGETYVLNTGDLIYNQSIKGFVINTSTGKGKSKTTTGTTRGDTSSDKEFSRIRVSSDNKPSKVDFYETEAQLDADTPVCTLDAVALPAVLKDYHGFEQYVPRKTADRKRVQGRILFFKITHDKQEEFKVINTEVQYKVLK